MNYKLQPRAGLQSEWTEKTVKG